MGFNLLFSQKFLKRLIFHWSWDSVNTQRSGASHFTLYSAVRLVETSNLQTISQHNRIRQPSKHNGSLLSLWYLDSILYHSNQLIFLIDMYFLGPMFGLVYTLWFCAVQWDFFWIKNLTRVLIVYRSPHTVKNKKHCHFNGKYGKSTTLITCLFDKCKTFTYFIYQIDLARHYIPLNNVKCMFCLAKCIWITVHLHGKSL